MQFAKDSFYIALRDRLAVLNPARTVYLDGVTRPAVIVAENQPSTPSGGSSLRSLASGESTRARSAPMAPGST